MRDEVKTTHDLIKPIQVNDNLCVLCLKLDITVIYRKMTLKENLKVCRIY